MLFFRMTAGCIQHGSTQAVTTVLLLQQRVVYTAFTALPKRRIVRKLIKGDCFKSQRGIQFHNGKTGGDAEYPGVGIFLAAERKYFLFDVFGYMQVSECGRYYKPG